MSETREREWRREGNGCRWTRPPCLVCLPCSCVWASHTSAPGAWVSQCFCQLGMVCSWGRLNCRPSAQNYINVYIYHCENVFLIKIRKWKASWEQNLPTGFLWKLTRSNEVWNWPTFQKPPKLQKRKWDSEIWSECKLRKVLVIPEFVLGVWPLPGVQGRHCWGLSLTSCGGLAVGPAAQEVLMCLLPAHC